MNRWHNHLDPNVKKEALTAKEEKMIFEAQKKLGNKWADIARELPGRTDNVVKNYFYSTLRRELRYLIRKLKGDQTAEPKEVSVEYLQELLHKNKLGYDSLKNQNIKELIKYLDVEGIVAPNKNDHDIPKL